MDKLPTREDLERNYVEYLSCRENQEGDMEMIARVSCWAITEHQAYLKYIDFLKALDDPRIKTHTIELVGNQVEAYKSNLYSFDEFDLDGTNFPTQIHVDPNAEWNCICGNTATADGFDTINLEREYCEPDEGIWPDPGYYKCNRCKAVHRLI